MHNYLDLEIATVEQYSMIVDLEALEEWRQLGWKTYKEVQLPAGDEDAFRLYGEFDKRTQTLMFNKPVLLNEMSKDQLINREVIDAVMHLGNYGMGGAGFFGLLLDTEEYLTYATWSSGDFVIVNDRVVECSPEHYDKIKPWTSNYGDGLTWDELTETVSGSMIRSYELADDVFILFLSKNGADLKVEFVKQDSRLPKEREAYEDGQICDYILFQHKDATLIV
ncbi:hypothetical protein FUAX_01960 [Fulvitalea axinellae]|uniref:Uncharacterized protein n=1 Tax=Fulvitalea axinellae TaxID=1182444 RepID=A0AAU9CN53_9BACT|nr:hypothetical protein FUAX_01960 [Fulvitalea axinellae]